MPETDASSTAGEPFRLPDLGEGLTEAEVISWHVQQGDRVVADQPLVSVETDKAIVEIPAPHGGRVAELNAAEGEIINVGDVLLTFTPGDAAEPATAGTVVGDLTGKPATVASHQDTSPQLTTPHTRATGVQVSPRTRQRARELGVDLQQVEATGPQGVIQLDDVERAAATLSGKPLRGVRRAMAERMADANARVARASVNGDANISAWTPESHPLSRLIRAVGEACQAQPRLNSRFDDHALTLSEQVDVHLGIAMETKDGLFVPVLRNITNTSRDEIATQLQQLESDVTERRVKPQQLRGQTITLSNYGAVAGQYAEMVVVPPQVAIVGAGRSFTRLALVDGNVIENSLLPLSLTFDHRAVTGVEACEFLLAMTHDLEKSN